jgi:SAM-dependent methyltransferase
MRDPLTALRNALTADPLNPWSRRLRRLVRPAWLAPFRTVPLSSYWGLDRGTPVDRYYVERFLKEQAADIRGRVVELQDRGYTDRFGSAVDRSEVLDVNPNNPLATVVADLTTAHSVPNNSFDCFILTQTLQFIFDVPAAVNHVHRMLRPGGVVLVTVPSVSRIAPVYGLERDYWRFTTASCRRLFGTVFGADAVAVRSYGNVRTATAFLSGLASEELSRRELDAQDEYFPLIVAVRAVKR